MAERVSDYEKLLQDLMVKVDPSDAQLIKAALEKVRSLDEKQKPPLPPSQLEESLTDETPRKKGHRLRDRHHAS